MNKPNIEELLKMINRGEDELKKLEDANIRNDADSLVFATENALKDLGDKADKKDKEEAEEKLEALKEALKGEDTVDIKAKTESLQEIAMKLAQKVYENAAKEQQANNEETKTEETSKKDDDVEEANYEEK